MSNRRRQARGIGRPPGDTAERTRAEILDAALDAFADTGFEATSVRELTRRLGMSHNLVHHHFGAKQDLWRAAIDHGLGPTTEELFTLLRASVGSPNPVDVVREGMERAMALLRRRPAVARILADESARPGPRLDYLYDRYMKPGMAVLRRFLNEARDQGLRDIDSRVALLFLLSTATAPFTHGALSEKLGLGAGAKGRYMTSLTELMLGGLAAPTSSDR
jgi:AcrR family transcriptional regulator